ncbi:MAG: hypothetical protein GF344_16225 [Chitinivibrionales bacterium]|nr:hypothetical protein [Chitinivibrionales bacterium]MBD3358239.1 hypothetical protein [Chitinivibrionales bacterium]
MLKTRVFYALKPLVPRRLQLELRRRMVLHGKTIYASTWPIDTAAARPPTGWNGWPGGKRFALVLTHDVEHFFGQRKCLELARLEEVRGFRSSFNFVPERYPVSKALHKSLRSMGFEIGVHDYNHDGKLFSSERLFDLRAKAINRYLAEWSATGFRSGAMHHNLEWIGRLDIEYDCSTFDTDPFEPQPDGVRTIFPFQVNTKGSPKEYVEMPYTLPQDFTLYVLMKEEGPTIWKRKLDWVAANGGMALVNVHPDYMSFDGSRRGLEQYPASHYIDLLDYAYSKYGGEYWQVLPSELAHFWSKIRHKIRNVKTEAGAS